MRVESTYRETYEKIFKLRFKIESQCKGCTIDQANRRANIFAVKNTRMMHQRGFIHP